MGEVVGWAGGPQDFFLNTFKMVDSDKGLNLFLVI